MWFKEYVQTYIFPIRTAKWLTQGKLVYPIMCKDSFDMSGILIKLNFNSFRKYFHCIPKLMMCRQIIFTSDWSCNVLLTRDYKSLWNCILQHTFWEVSQRVAAFINLLAIPNDIIPVFFIMLCIVTYHEKWRISIYYHPNLMQCGENSSIWQQYWHLNIITTWIHKSENNSLWY